ncbi:hypothetical protein DFH27DRAFT_644061 [Peziza echinospora]|nr:hypothetical protein DFH27DRAFT_644061 [Peziza echinospora]
MAAVKFVHYAYPPLQLLYFMGASCASWCLLQEASTTSRRVRRGSLLCLTLGVIATYVGRASPTPPDYWFIHSSKRDGGHLNTMWYVYVIASILAWGVLQLTLLENNDVIWHPYLGSWLIGLSSETILILSTVVFDDKPTKSGYKSIQLLIQSIRLGFLILMPIIYWCFRLPVSEVKPSTSGESAPLLGQVGANNSYGAVIDINGPEEPEARKEREFKERVRKRREESGGWWSYAKSFSIFWPYIWPQKERGLQLNMALVGLCLLMERGLNILVPRQLGKVTDALMAGGPFVGSHLPWKEVSIFIMFRWLDSGAGIPAVQRYLWVPVDQYAYRSITTAAYNHVMNLSSDFHTAKNTGELYSSVNQGRSVNGFVEMILFSIIPMLADLAVAFGYFYFVFGSYMALVVGIVSVLYVWVTAVLSRMRAQMRRNYNQTARRETQLMWQTMSSWETVSYFNRIAYEQDRYSGAIKSFQTAERDYINGLAILNVTQSVVFTVGLLCASFLAVYQVTMGQLKVGDFVALLSYWAQLATPLSFFTSFFRRIQDLMLDAERLLELFETKATVVSKPCATDLVITKGEVSFEDVSFSYDARKGAITGMSFIAPGGQTTALVGETGGGKSTCLKLLFRFYDVTSGSVKIDGQDVREVSLDSLRDQIGVVPQEPKLFNESIMDNLRYASFESTDEEIFEACRAAAIHDKILSFPDGYLSKVGEGGVKLSGGEKQRISIARAILKNPKIVLLDEATSSVDVATERQIQHAFNKLAAGRTMFVIAHRLSTIMNADQILVINDGNIIERGKHADLLKLGGKYSALWMGELDNQVSKKQLLDTPPVTPRSDDLILMDEPVVSSALTTTTAPTTTSTTTTKPSTNPPILSTAQTVSTPLNIKFAAEVPKRVDIFRPHTYPRLSMSAPKLECMKQDKENIPSTAAKNESILKPEAKEFVPTSNPSALLCNTSGNIGGSHLPAQLQPFFVSEADGKIGPSDDTALYDSKSVGGDEQNDSKRRRRHRRRSRSSRNSSGNDSAQLPDIPLAITGQSSNDDAFMPDVTSTDCQVQTGAKRNREAIGKVEAPRSSLPPPNDALTQITFNSTHFSTLPESVSSTNVQRYVELPRPGLYEATPNVPSVRRTLTSNREGRGGSVPRWKPHGPGKSLLSNTGTNGYGATNQISVVASKDLMDAGAISHSAAISGQKSLHEKARVSQRS